MALYLKESLFLWKYTSTYPIDNILTSSDYEPPIHLEMNSLKLPAVSDLMCLQSIYLACMFNTLSIVATDKWILILRLMRKFLFSKWIYIRSLIGYPVKVWQRSRYMYPHILSTQHAASHVVSSRKRDWIELFHNGGKYCKLSVYKWPPPHLA